MKDYKVCRNNALNKEFCYIHAGTFMMGQSSKERIELITTFGQERYMEHFNRELPQHEENVDPFWIAKHPITISDFSTFTKKTNWITDAEKNGWSWHRVDGKWKQIQGLFWCAPGYPQGDQHPAVHLSWYDAIGFAEWMTSISGDKFDLPSAAEWEYAARGGDCENFYSGSNDVYRVAWIEDNCGGNPQPVGIKANNGFGLHDMSGNVWEWCKDFFDTHNYKKCILKNRSDLSTNTRRVSRGGAWHNTRHYVRCANHHGTDPIYHGSNFGLRLSMYKSSR